MVSIGFVGLITGSIGDVDVGFINTASLPPLPEGTKVLPSYCGSDRFGARVAGFSSSSGRTP